MHMVSAAPVSAAPKISRFKVTLVAIAFIVASSPVVFRDRLDVFNLTMGTVVLALFLAAKSRAQSNGGVSVFLLWAVASLFWTYDFATSVEEVAALVLTSAAALVAATFGPRVVARGLLVGGLIAVTLSWAVGLLLPGRGKSFQYGGALIGIYAHRNFLASVMVVGLALALAVLISRTSSRVRFGAFLATGLFATAVVATLSGSAIVISAVAVLIGLALSFVRALSPALRFALLPFITVLVGAFLVPWLVRTIPEITSGVGRDATLTGRTEIWAFVLETWSERPLTGYGWGGVWRGATGDWIRAMFGFDTALSAHNGYLDVLLQLGIIGATLLGLVLIFATIRSIRLAVSNPSLLWLPLVLGAVLVNSFSESQLTRPFGIFLIVLISTIARQELTTRHPRKGKDRAGGESRPVPNRRYLLPSVRTRAEALKAMHPTT